MKYILICNYCDHKWQVTYKYQTEDVICPICKDKNIRIKELQSKDIFGYNIKWKE